MTRKLFIHLLLFGSAWLLSGCAGGPPPPAVVLPVSHYDIISPDYDWAALKQSFVPGEILLIERVGDGLGILKEGHRSGRRARSVLKYAGAIVNYGRYRMSSALSGHKLVGLGSDPDLVNSIARIGKNLSRFSSDLSGLTIVVDSVEKLTDPQLRSLVSAPAECLVLDGLHYVTIEQASIIAGFGGSALSLNKVMWIGCPQIRELNKFAGEYLSLNGIRTVTDEQAADFSRYPGTTLMLGSIDSESKLLLRNHRTAETATIITSLD